MLGSDAYIPNRINHRAKNTTGPPTIVADMCTRNIATQRIYIYIYSPPSQSRSQVTRSKACIYVSFYYTNSYISNMQECIAKKRTCARRKKENPKWKCFILLPKFGNNGILAMLPYSLRGSMSGLFVQSIWTARRLSPTSAALTADRPAAAAQL